MNCANALRDAAAAGLPCAIASDHCDRAKPCNFRKHLDDGSTTLERCVANCETLGLRREGWKDPEDIEVL